MERDAERQGFLKIISSIAAFICLTLILVKPAYAELRIAAWNMANRPNDSGQQADVTTIINGMGEEIVSGLAKRLDILAMSEIDNSGSWPSADKICDAFNTLYSVSSYANILTSPDGGGDSTGFVYDSSNVYLLDAVQLNESESGLEHNILHGHFQDIASELEFYLYSIHLKSGASTNEEDRRATEAQIIRSDADALGADARIIYLGDFNWNSADESSNSFDSAYDRLVQLGNGQAYDVGNDLIFPADGEWRDNAFYKVLHSQNPGGPLDDRFDAQFITYNLLDNTDFYYIDGSYRVFGNDGSHMLDQSITTGYWAPPGVSDPSAVLVALSAFSDHLPVVADYSVGENQLITYAQLAMGGGYEATFFATNKNTVAWSGRYRVRQGYDEEWSNPWTVNDQDVSGQDWVDFSLQPLETRKVIFRGDATTRSGYLEIEAQGSSLISEIATAYFYDYHSGGYLQNSTGSAPSIKDYNLIFPVEYTEDVDVGYAICPTDRIGNPFPIKLSIFDHEGVKVAEETISFAGQFAEFISQRFPVIQSMAPFVGHVLVEAEKQIGMDVLRMEHGPGRFLFTSTPPARANF